MSGRLRDRERALSLREVARLLDCSPATVARLERAALEKLRAAAETRSDADAERLAPLEAAFVEAAFESYLAGLMRCRPGEEPAGDPPAMKTPRDQELT